MTNFKRDTGQNGSKRNHGTFKGEENLYSPFIYMSENKLDFYSGALSTVPNLLQSFKQRPLKPFLLIINYVMSWLFRSTHPEGNTLLEPHCE